VIELQGDLQKPLVSALEPASGLLIVESAPVHFEEVACGRDFLTNARGIALVEQLGAERTGT
jgi:hypothetical protein